MCKRHPDVLLAKTMAQIIMFRLAVVVECGYISREQHLVEEIVDDFS